MNGTVPHAQQPPAGRRGSDLTNELLLELTNLQLRFERQVMDQLSQLQAAVADLTAAQADATAKVDVLLQKNDLLIDLADNLEVQLKALVEGGQLPPAAFSDLIASIDSAKTAYAAIGSKVDGEAAKIDTALAADAPVPPAPPAPSPAPEPAPAPAPAPGDGSDTPPDTASAENGPETP